MITAPDGPVAPKKDAKRVCLPSTPVLGRKSEDNGSVSPLYLGGFIPTEVSKEQGSVEEYRSKDWAAGDGWVVYYRNEGDPEDALELVRLAFVLHRHSVQELVLSL